MRYGLVGILFSSVALVAQPQNGPLDSALMRRYDARAVAVTGQVNRTRDATPWAVSPGERVPVQQVITTGRDGYGQFVVAGGGSFEVFSNSRVLFRQNAASAGDLLDVVEGRVRIWLRPDSEQPVQRVLTPLATITANQDAMIAVAIDEDGAIRIDVLEGEVRIQHRLLPRNDATIVRAVDAILVRGNQQISRRVDRGTLYRYAIKPLHNLWAAVTPGHSHSGEPIEGNRLAANFVPRRMPLQ